MYEFSIPDMSCGHCVSSVTKAIKAVDPDAIADVDLIKRRAAVETKADAKSISDALENAGYPAVLETE